LKAIVAADSP